MRSQKLNNLLAAGSFLTGAIMLGLTFWYRAYPDSSIAPSVSGRAIMLNGWLPIIVMSLAVAYSASSLIIASYRTRKNTQLSHEISRLEDERSRVSEATQTASAKHAKVQKALDTAQKQVADETNSKNTLYELKRDLDRQLAEWSWLHSRAEEQAKDLASYVKITSRRLGLLELTESPRSVKVELKLQNQSVFDITVQAENATGQFFLDGQPLHDPVKAVIFPNRPFTEKLSPNQTAVLTLTQPFLRHEAETIAERREKGTGRFELGFVTVPLAVTGINVSVPASSLRIIGEFEHVLISEFA